MSKMSKCGFFNPEFWITSWFLFLTMRGVIVAFSGDVISPMVASTGGLPVTRLDNASDAGAWRWPNDIAPLSSAITVAPSIAESTTPQTVLPTEGSSAAPPMATTEATVATVRQRVPPTTPLTSTVFPTLDEDLYMEEDRQREKSPEFQAGISGSAGHFASPALAEEEEASAVPEAAFRPRPFVQERNKSSWIDRIKSLFVPSGRNTVLAHAMEAGAQFREKYGSSRLPAPQSLYGGGGGGGGGGGESYPSNPQTYSEYRPSPGAMIPDGAFAPVYKPSVKMKLTADFVELNCAVDGRIQRGIRWVKLVGLNPHGHQLFATVADGERILFDTYHFGVRTDGKHSRLIIRNPEPHAHYGVYQCQASVAGDASIIVKEDFVVGKVV